ncbi:MAG: hypothetical protein ACYCWW_05840 [Deltaproteobacteria bacterium]
MSSTLAHHRLHPLAVGGAGSLLASGALAGLCGGAAMAALALLLAATSGAPLYRPLLGVASFFLGGATLSMASPAAIAVGVLAHVGASMALGIVFAAIFGGLPLEAMIPWGILFGLAVALVLRFVVLPAADLSAVGPLSALVSEHALYGASLWLVLPFRQALERP